MNSRWNALVSAPLVAFAILVIAWQVGHWNATDYSSIATSCLRAEQLPKISTIWDRNQPHSGMDPMLDLALPKDARVFMMNMTGPTNYAKLGQFYFTTYYLFPR